MRYPIFLFVAILFLVNPVYHSKNTLPPDQFSSSVSVGSGLPSKCLSTDQLNAALRQLMDAGEYVTQQKAVTLLVADANRSQDCREQVVTALMTAMNKHGLDLRFDRPNFYLWHYGSKILAGLKAVEALDLLIANFDLDDGTPFPLDHHPALVAVINIGEIAIPKLAEVLNESNDGLTRRYAVFCLAEIGGRSSKMVLEQAVIANSDACLSTFIRTTLDAFRNESLPDHIVSENRAKWYSTFSCHSR